MNILDENIITPERERLRAWRIHFRRVGGEVGRLGMKDHNEIIPLLHSFRRPTFFTRDHGFYHPRLRHTGYCLVYLEVGADEVAGFIRRTRELHEKGSRSVLLVSCLPRVPWAHTQNTGTTVSRSPLFCPARAETCSLVSWCGAFGFLYQHAASARISVNRCRFPLDCWKSTRRRVLYLITGSSLLL